MTINCETKILYDHIVDAVRSSVTETKIGVAFSGGVDSTLLAKICSDLGYNVILLTVGFSNSHDIEFSKKISSMLDLPHKVFEINHSSFRTIYTKVHNKIPTSNLSWHENCMAFYYVSKFARCYSLHEVITANGIDELFCGYDRYRTVINDGVEAVNDLMNSKLENEIQMMSIINKIVSEQKVKFIQPLLSSSFIKFAKTIPIRQKIHDKNDLIRKHILRKLALEIGVPEISALKKKKALQYGSKIHKELLKLKKIL